ncbi:MAG: hypothetical protein C0504_00385 [Candidatus Solibacter sp.]|nr:hypothetical protein [Candidatus Solibacter sp.]
MAWDNSIGALNSACLAAFGRLVTYRPAAGAPVELRGILQTGVQLEGRAPGVYAVLFLQAAGLPAGAGLGDAVEIGADTYKVFEMETDAGGGVKLALRKE